MFLSLRAGVIPDGKCVRRLGSTVLLSLRAGVIPDEKMCFAATRVRSFSPAPQHLSVSGVAALPPGGSTPCYRLFSVGELLPCVRALMSCFYFFSCVLVASFAVLFTFCNEFPFLFYVCMIVLIFAVLFALSNEISERWRKSSSPQRRSRAG